MDSVTLDFSIKKQIDHDIIKQNFYPGRRCIPVIPAFEEKRQEDCEFKGSVGYMLRFFYKQTNEQADLWND